MDPLTPLLHLSAIHILMAMVPGPNSVVVGHCSAHSSRRAGLFAAAGVSAASLLWVSASLLGIGALLLHAGDLFRILRLLGAAYLIFIGLRMLRACPQDRGGVPTGVTRSPFGAGFLTTLSNPKSAIFWTSVFALVVPAEAPAWFYGAILIIILAQSFAWYGAIALAFSAPRVRGTYGRMSRLFNRIAGAFMLFFGLKVANDLRAEIAAEAL